jgi:hypothetical protein
VAIEEGWVFRGLRESLHLICNPYQRRWAAYCHPWGGSPCQINAKLVYSSKELVICVCDGMGGWRWRGRGNNKFLLKQKWKTLLFHLFYQLFVFTDTVWNILWTQMKFHIPNENIWSSFSQFFFFFWFNISFILKLFHAIQWLHWKLLRVMH